MLFVLARQQSLNTAVRACRFPQESGRQGLSSIYCTHRALTGAVFFSQESLVICDQVTPRPNQSLSAVAPIAILVSVFPPASAAEVASKQFSARTELRPIQTLTRSDSQFLTGGSTGKQATLVGQLRIAQGSGRQPQALHLSHKFWSGHSPQGIHNEVYGAGLVVHE
jgi:hypothetical protein